MFGLAVVATAAFGWLWQQARSDLDAARATTREQAQVKAVAARLLVALTNFDAKTIDADVAKLRALAVGQFAGDVDDVFTPERIAQIKRFDATSTGKIRSVFIQSLSGDSASVFAVVDETLRNSRSPARTDTVRFDISMVQTKGGWKIENLEILQLPATPFAPGP